MITEHRRNAKAHPGQLFIGGHAEGHGEEDREGRVLARMVEGRVMAHLGGAVHDGIHALQGRDKLTRREGGDGQAATRGAGDTLGKALCPGANARQVLGP